MIEYQLLPAHEIKGYLQANEERHWSDIKDKSLYTKTCVNWEVYEELSREGLCYAVVATGDEGIVGYNVYMLTADFNKNDEVLATDVALYIEKDYRGSLVVDFIKQCDRLLKELEVKRVMRSFCDERLCKILARADYKPRSITMSKSL